MNMVGNGKRIGERFFPYNINLPDDPNWIYVTRGGLAEYIVRQRASATLSCLLEPALDFCADQTGDALWHEVGDGFVFSADRRGAVSISRDIDGRLRALRDRLIATTAGAAAEVRWSNRFVVAAVLYAYCGHFMRMSWRHRPLHANADLNISV